MSLTQFADLSTIIQGGVVVISLFFIMYQLWQATKLAKAANAQALAEQAATFNALLIQDREVASLWYSYGKDTEQLKGINRFRYRELLVQWLITHENIYYQHKQGLLDREIYTVWLNDLRETIENHNLDIVAKPITKIFPGAYGEHLGELQKVVRPPW
jgi:hypothetical protein